MAALGVSVGAMPAIARLRTWFVAIAVALVFASAAAQRSFPVEVYFFWGDGCPYCHQELAFLDELTARFPDVTVHAFEVWNDTGNRVWLQAFSDAFDQPVRAVPVTFIGEHAWIGFSEVIAGQIAASVEGYRAYEAPDAVERLDEATRAAFLATLPE